MQKSPPKKSIRSLSRPAKKTTPIRQLRPPSSPIEERPDVTQPTTRSTTKTITKEHIEQTPSPKKSTSTRFRPIKSPLQTDESTEEQQPNEEEIIKKPSHKRIPKTEIAEEKTAKSKRISKQVISKRGGRLSQKEQPEEEEEEKEKEKASEEEEQPQEDEGEKQITRKRTPKNQLTDDNSEEEISTRATKQPLSKRGAKVSPKKVVKATRQGLSKKEVTEPTEELVPAIRKRSIKKTTEELPPPTRKRPTKKSPIESKEEELPPPTRKRPTKKSPIESKEEELRPTTRKRPTKKSPSESKEEEELRAPTRKRSTKKSPSESKEEELPAPTRKRPTKIRVPQSERVEEQPSIEEQPVVEQPIIEKQPIIEEQSVVEQPVEEPIIEEPIIEKQSVVEQPVEEQPIIEELSVVEQPVEEPIIEKQPIIEEQSVVEEQQVVEKSNKSVGRVAKNNLLKRPGTKARILKETSARQGVRKEQAGMGKRPAKAVGMTSLYPKEWRPQTEKEEKEWLGKLKKYLRGLFNNLVKEYDNDNKLNEIDKLTDDDAMKIWKIVFTQASYAYEQGENYEVPEKLGDGLTGAVFLKYLYSVLPKILITQQNLSLFKNHYMSRKEQAKLSDKMGLIEYLRLGPYEEAKKNIKEDLFEAFFGGIEIVGDKIGIGAGYIITKYFIDWLFKDLELDTTVLLGPEKTQVKEIFDALNWFDDTDTRKFNVQITRKQNKLVYSVLYSNKALAFLKTNFNIQPDALIGQAEATNKKEAEAAAFIDVLNNLTKLGVTIEFATKTRAYYDSIDPELKDYYMQAYEKAIANGFKQFRFSKKGTSFGAKIMDLVGEMPDGTESILATILTFSTKYNAGKYDVLQKYINS